MGINKLLEEKLWSITRPNPLNQKEFVEIIEYLFVRLSEYLRRPLEVTGEDAVHEDSFNRSFRGEISPVDPFRITFVGILELGLVGDGFRPHINAWIFLFGDGFRLTAGETDRSYTEFVYDKINNTTGRWRSLGWMIDEFGQFEGGSEEDFI